MAARTERSAVPARVGWLGAAIVMAGIASLHALGAQRAVRFGPSLALHAVAALGWGGVIWAVVQGWRPRFGVALGLVLLVRAIAVPIAPALSDDYYRYLYEGHAVVRGVSPYLCAPDDAPVELRGAYHDRINHPEVPAAYPPAVQWALAGAASLQPRAQNDPTPFPWALKGLFSLCDVLVFCCLWGWLRSRGSPPAMALVHGLCPLVVVEYSIEAHSDSLAVLGMVAGLWAVRAGGLGLAGLALGLGTAAKFLPAVLVPFVARGRGLRPWLGWAGALALLCLPFVVQAGARMADAFSGTGAYVARWRHNDTIYSGVRWLIERGTESLGPSDLDAERLAKVPLAVAGVLLLYWAWRRRWSPGQVGLGFFVFFVAAAPTVHPWYLGFLVPFLAVCPNPGWLAFCAMAYLSYHVLPPFVTARDAGLADLDAYWVENYWLKAAEYAPFYLGFMVPCWPRIAAAAPPAGLSDRASRRTDTSTGSDRS